VAGISTATPFGFSRSLDVGRGLARVEAAASMMIVYSTEPGKVALDGTGRNSPLTAALLRHIDSQGESISDVMIDVRNDVLSATSGKQRPFESASLTGQFFFKPNPTKTADTASTGAEIAALRDEISKLQADQGALLKSQQEQLARLQKKLDDATKSAEPSGQGQQASAANTGADSRVIAVEPASGNTPLSAPTTNPAPTSAASPGTEQDTKIAAADGKDTTETAAEVAKPAEAPLPVPTASSLRRTCSSSFRSSGAISAASTAAGARVRSWRLSGSTGCPSLRFGSRSPNRQVSMP
jgi:uncharacterized caspase-like protein